MDTPTDERVLGLSPKARRLVFPAVGLAILIVMIGTVTNRRDDKSEGDGPAVGGDLHAVNELDDRLFVGGHAGAAYRVVAGGWTQIQTLGNVDVMSWAGSSRGLLAGGHAGLYRSTDKGSTFAAVTGLPVSDVHALGASGSRVYLASPEAGVLVSDDAGTSFQPAGPAGRDFMGTIWVDPSNPDVAIAPSMQSGAVRTADGGETWTSLGSASGVMAVAVGRSGKDVVAVGMSGAQVSDDAGATWSSLDVPDGSSGAAYTSAGELVVAALSGNRAQVYRSASGGWKRLS